MKRRRYLVAYDISDPKRLAKVRRKVAGFGDSMQYSVFVCDINAAEKAQLVEGLFEIIDPKVDRVAFVDIGLDGESDRFMFLGARPKLPISGPRIF